MEHYIIINGCRLGEHVCGLMWGLDLGDQWVRDCSSIGSELYSGEIDEKSSHYPFYIMEHAGSNESCRENVMSQV